MNGKWDSDEGFCVKRWFQFNFKHSICLPSSWIDWSACPVLLYTHMVVLEVYLCGYKCQKCSRIFLLSLLYHNSHSWYYVELRNACSPVHQILLVLSWYSIHYEIYGILYFPIWGRSDLYPLINPTQNTFV